MMARQKKPISIPQPFDLCRETPAELIKRGQIVWELDYTKFTAHSISQPGSLTVIFSAGALRWKKIRFFGVLDYRFISPLSCDPREIEEGVLYEVELNTQTVAALDKRLREVFEQMGAGIPPVEEYPPLKRYLIFTDGFGCFDLLARSVSLPRK